MERLTKIDKYGHPYTNENINCRNLVSENGINYQYVGYVDNFKAFDGKPIDKLSKLEDIEDDLGIPLEVLFKALKEGIVMDGEEYRTFLMYDEVSNSCCFKCGGWGKYFLKDYGVTWTLNREELENAKD